MKTDIFNNGYAKFDLTTKKNQNIIIYLSGSPNPDSIDIYAQYMRDFRVTDIFCFCEPLYNPIIFQKYNLEYHNLAYSDGTLPNTDILNNFDRILNIILNKKNVPMIINIHCHSGMGRSPTVLAYLMITRCGFTSIDSISYIRKYRKGSFNSKQLEWIFNIKPNTYSVKKDLCTLL